MKEVLHIYCRVSSSIQEQDGTSLDSQQQLGKLKAKQLKLTSKVWMEGASSSDHDEIEKREVLSALMTAIEDGQVKHLYVTEQSRLARTDYVASMIRYRCNVKNVTLYIRDTVYDFSNPMDILTVQIMGAFSQFENAVRKERSRLGKLQKVKQGYWHGGAPPFGYELKAYKDGNKLAINKQESKWVKEIFERYSREHSIKNIQTMLRDNYVLARRGKTFSTGSLGSLIKNTHYTGHYIFVDSVSNETIEVSCPSIVSKSIWDECNKKQEEILKRKGQVNRTKRFSLLKEFLWCGHCGTGMGARINPTKKENYYYCPKKDRQWKDSFDGSNDNTADTNQTKKWERGRHCEMTKSLNIPVTNDRVFEVVSEIASKSNFLREQIKSEMMSAKSKTDAESKTQMRNLLKKRKEYEKEVSELEGAIGRIETDRVMKRISASETKLVKTNITKELTDYQERLKEVSDRLDDIAQRAKWVDWVSKFEKTYTNLGKLGEEKKQEYLRGLIKRIDVKLDTKAKGHILDLKFQFPVVNDKFEWLDMNAKPRTYKVTKGRYSKKLKGGFTSKHYSRTDRTDDSKKKQ